MPGMGTGLNANDPTIAAAFHAALLHQGLIVLGILALVGVTWNVLRAMQLRRAAAGEGGASASLAFSYPEPVARRLLRICFGLIWIFDGILQAQASMPLGMAPQVIQPAAATSPTWVQHLANSFATIWSYHPITAPAAAVWIQIGIGVWLLTAPRGHWSRLGGLASLGWGIIVWVSAEAFGGIFAPGLTWPTQQTMLFIVLRWLSGILGAAGLTVMAWKTLLIPNTQSATGILYVGVIATFLGELTALLLHADAIFPL